MPDVGEHDEARLRNPRGQLFAETGWIDRIDPALDHQGRRVDLVEARPEVAEGEDRGELPGQAIKRQTVEPIVLCQLLQPTGMGLEEAGGDILR